MPENPFVLYEPLDDGQIVKIMLNRPEARNAQNRGLLVELHDAFLRAEADDDVRVVILGGVGPMFSSGHDLGSKVSMEEYLPGPNQHPTRTINGANRTGAEGLMLQEWHYFFENTRRWRNLRKITIGQAHGDVYAAGLMLLWACDLIVCAQSATFADVVGTRLGMCGVEYFAHPWEFGPRKAKELLLTGDSIDADEAYGLGMVSKVFPDDELADRTLQFARRIARLPTMSALLIKEAVNQSVDNMGFYNALNACFTLHELNHSHWAQVNDDGYPVAKEDSGIPNWREAPPIVPAVKDKDASGVGRVAANDPESTAALPESAPDGAGSITRRAPFSDNPTVGARGQRTQQRILDAALRVFGDEGYHQTSIDRIAKHAGCSRVSFYQYFSSKEDVFRHLAGQVGRQVSASTEALDPLTPDAAGWASLRAWVARYGDIYERYEPVFLSFAAAAESDESIAGGSARVAARYIAGLRSRLATTAHPPRQLDPVVTLLVECLTDTCYQARILRPAAPESYPRARVEDAVTDVMHRSLFGKLDDVNVHPPARRRPPVIPFDANLQQLFGRAVAPPATTTDAGHTITALMDAGREVFVQRGYHGTRVDDIVAAAGLSHGAFYRYFENKATFAHAIAAQAMLRMSSTFAELPANAHDGPVGKATLRRWLRRYNAAHAEEAAIVRVWVDATTQDPSLGHDSAPVVDWGRRQLARFLAPRGFGDDATEAVVLVGLLAAYGARQRPAAMTEAAALIIEQGLLGREADRRG